MNLLRRKIPSTYYDVLTDRLNKLCLFLDDTYNINSGGCCLIAYLLAKLLNSDNVEYAIVVFEGDNKKQELVSTFKELIKSHEHYALKVGDKYINVGEFGKTAHRTFNDVKVKDIYNHYKNGDWNECYDVDKTSFLSIVVKRFYNDFTADLRK